MRLLSPFEFFATAAYRLNLVVNSTKQQAENQDLLGWS
jgi:hypothetical protein